nr:MAG TPA: hypothetical protein [Caudoviricetes sp.]
MKFEFKYDDCGLKNMIKKLETAGKSTEGKHSFNEIFPPAFMRKYTNYSDIDNFLENCGFPYKTDEEFKAIPDDAFDEYVRKSSRFKSWKEMLDTGSQELFNRNLKKAGL